MIQREIIHLSPQVRPILSVVIHTEEEFDWAKAHDRNATTVAHMSHIDRAQSLFDEFGIVPNYVIDYPIATQEQAYGPLRTFADSGRALIGTHLHPWVSPPFSEELTARNSYPGNLAPALEREKLAQLTECIAAVFGARPVTYLAGRYGFGQHTGQILEELGYEVDISAAVPIDYRADGGPDYSAWTSHPYWFGKHRDLLGLPGTGGYIGHFRAGGTRLYRALQQPALRKARVSGAAARLRFIERVRLSPEDYSEPEMRRLTKALLDDGIRVFVFSFHSPSVMPGGTPYVRNGAELQRFLDKCRTFFTFFLGDLGGVAMTPLQVKSFLQTASPPVIRQQPSVPAGNSSSR